VIGVVLRVRHGERPEDPLLGEVAQALSARAAHDLPEEEVAGIAVLVAISRREDRALLPGERFERLGLRGDVLFAVPLELEEADVVAQTPDVMEQVPDRHALSEIGELRQELADVVVERELAVPREEEDREGGELLADRPDVEDRLGGVGDAKLQVRHAVAARIDDAAVLIDAEGAAGRVAPVVFGEEGVDFRFRVGGRRLGREEGSDEDRGDPENDRKPSRAKSHRFLPALARRAFIRCSSRIG
jgi:hypothetical protein